MSTKIDWEPIRKLAQQVFEHGAPLDLTEDTRALLSRTAQEVGINPSEAVEALRSVNNAAALLKEAIQRINDGSDRITRALRRMADLRDKGDLEGASQQMRDVLADEVVPIYRRQAEKRLMELAQLAEVAATGRVNASLPDRLQLTVLERRIREGQVIELTEGLATLLRRSAPTAGIGEAETEEALKNPAGSQALIGKMLSRFREGKERITRALLRMTSLRDAGDIEGARQQMRSVLAVETVPQYRQMAEENLAGLDSPPRGK